MKFLLALFALGNIAVASAADGALDDFALSMAHTLCESGATSFSASACESAIGKLQGDQSLVSDLVNSASSSLQSACTKDGGASLGPSVASVCDKLKQKSITPDQVKQLLISLIQTCGFNSNVSAVGAQIPLYCDSAKMAIASAVAHVIEARSWQKTNALCTRRCEEEKYTKGYVAYCDESANSSIALSEVLIKGLDAQFKKLQAQNMNAIAGSAQAVIISPEPDLKQIEADKKAFKNASACAEKMWADQRRQSNLANVDPALMSAIANLEQILPFVGTNGSLVAEGPSVSPSGSPGSSKSDPPETNGPPNGVLDSAGSTRADANSFTGDVAVAPDSSPPSVDPAAQNTGPLSTLTASSCAALGLACGGNGANLARAQIKVAQGPGVESATGGALRAPASGDGADGKIRLSMKESGAEDSNAADENGVIADSSKSLFEIVSKRIRIETPDLAAAAPEAVTTAAR